MKKYPFDTKTLQELIEEANRILASSSSELAEEAIEDDADGGYFEDD